MSPEDIEQLKKFKDYPEGSLSKKSYELYYLPFQDYLNKYYKIPDLKRWNYWNGKFVWPLNESEKHAEYMKFLQAAKPPFFPEVPKFNAFYNTLKDDNRFDEELKLFFSFLYSINFFKNLTFEEWLSVKYWNHPWHKENDYNAKSILEILSYEFGSNYLKEVLLNIGSLENP